MFNSKGEVIGVATFNIIGGQNLNIAIPIKYVAKLFKGTDGIEAKIGYYDLQYVMQNSNAGKLAGKNFKFFYDKSFVRIKEVETALRSRKDYLEKSSSNMTSETQKEAESDYFKRLEAYKLLVENVNSELERIETEQNYKLKTQIMKIIDRIKEKEKYSSIIEKNTKGIIYLMSKDITKRLIEEFNKNP